MVLAPVKSAYPSTDVGVREVDQSSKREQVDTTKPEVDNGSPEVVVEPPFSIYSTPEKKWIRSVASFGAMLSTLSSYIYFPALVPIATKLHVSLTLINLTVTSYMIVAGIAPAFMGDIPDQGGRRIMMFALVFGSNIGLALQMKVGNGSSIFRIL
ncbi:hypothetical protein N7520_003469 [Penicillium odoratum]|uniref:uncharacterized protein n=1 Tax=Penicillium odoratum TaxID=1167516 RepID=UPI0025482127|nr:uncharacterized protein N7520_003469 [Penicillium odoratum]KAJ5768910.1 hypothetical protein N7520_003469 [Penicillium odoratum]